MPPNAFSPESMMAYQPETGKEWQRRIDHSAIGKRLSQPLSDHGVEHYLFVHDVCDWAMDSTLKYVRYRMRWGEWSKRQRESYTDVHNTFFFKRPRTQRGCKFLVRWFVRFANARQRFHQHIADKVKRPWHSQDKVSRNAREIIQRRGRPRRLKMGRTANEDLWLILIWPIAVYHRWTYKDVVRALRLRFGYDNLKRPAPKLTKREGIRVLEHCLSEVRPHDRAMKSYTPKAHIEWRAQVLNVSNDDGKAMRLRCNRLGLEKLNPRRRDCIREPHLFEVAGDFHADE